MTAVSAKVLAKLKAIAAVAEGEFFAMPMQIKTLVDEGFLEVHPTLTNPKSAKEKAARLTDLGKAIIANDGELPGDDETEVGSFVIKTVALPPVSRNIDGGASKYPFAQLEPGQAFFIPATAGAKSPSKTFGSMVSANNKKYGTEANFRRFTTRSMLGDDFGQKGVKGIGVFRLSAADEAAAKAKAYPAAK